jgi:glycosyltransferase involved in cell wall biosynthesis
MRLLFISRWYPVPADNGSRLRIYNIIKQLHARHEIDLISFTSEPVSQDQLAAMQHYCTKVEVVPYRSFQPNRRQAVYGYFDRRPRSVVDTYSEQMAELICRVQRSRRYDAVIASQIDTAAYARAFRDTPRILEELELASLYERYSRESRPLRKLRAGLTWWKLASYVSDLLGDFVGCTVASCQELRHTIRLASVGCPVSVIPNGVDLTSYRGEWGSPQPDVLVYSGALTYGANLDAVTYFLSQIFPQIRAEHPNTRLQITGSTQGVPVAQLGGDPAVRFTGYLKDVRPAIAGSWASIVPLRVGGGTRLKILESLALGTPVIATSKGAEGLNLVPGRDLLIADTPDEFARAVIRLLGDPELRSQLSFQGRQAVAAYDWEIIGPQLSDFISSAAVGAQPTIRQPIYEC